MTSTSVPRRSFFWPVLRSLRLCRRGLYGMRAYIPGLSFHHACEKMVGPVGYWDALQRYQFNVLHENGIQPHHTLLDLGCGPLQGGVAFIRFLDAGNYTGVDLTASHLEAGYRQIANHRLAAKNPRLLQSSGFGDEQLGPVLFDYIWASQLLYIFDEKTVAAMLAVVSKRLKPGGKFLGDIVNPAKHAAVAAHYSAYVPHSLESMAILAHAAGLKVRSLGEIVQYRYPARLTLHQSLMLEFTRA